MKINGRVTMQLGQAVENLQLQAVTVLDPAAPSNTAVVYVGSTYERGIYWKSPTLGWELIVGNTKLNNSLNGVAHGVNVQTSNGTVFAQTLILDNDSSLTNSGTDTYIVRKTDPILEVSMTTSIDINTDTPLPMIWDQLDYEDAGYYIRQNNNTEIQFVEAGVYLIDYAIHSQYAGGKDQRVIRTYVEHNGSEVARSVAYEFYRNNTLLKGTNSAQCRLTVAANDYIRIIGMRSGDTGTSNIIANETNLAIQRIRK